MPSRYSVTPDAWDLELDLDGDTVGLMCVRQGDASPWSATEATDLNTQAFAYRESAVQWRNGGLGAGISIRVPEASGQGPDGQITSLGYSHGSFVTTVVDGLAMPSGKLTPLDLPAQLSSLSGRIFDAAEYGAARDVWLTTGTRYLVRLPGGTGAPDLGPQDLGVGTGSTTLTVFDGKLYTFLGDGSIWEYDGTTWAQATSVIRARGATVNWTVSNQLAGNVGGGGANADRLIGVDQTGAGFYHVAAGQDPKNALNWASIGGGVIPVGNPAYPIQNAVSSGDVVWFAKPNGLHGIDETGRVKNLTPWFEQTYDPSNGGCVAFYSDESQALVFIAHAQGLVAVTVNGTTQHTARFVQFGAKGPNLTPIWGRPRWFCPTIDGLFVAYFDELSGTSYVMRLVLRKDGSYRWSGPEAVITGEEVTFMKVISPTGNPRLLIATILNTGGLTGSLRLYAQSLPASGNPFVDWQAQTSHRFATAWSVNLPREDAGSSAQKVVRRYDLVVRNLAAGGGTAGVSASVDDAAYVAQGAITSGPRASFLADSDSATGVNFDWRLDLTNDEAEPAILESFQARVSVLPEAVPVWTFVCQLAPGQGLGNDAEDVEDPFSIWLKVRALSRRGPIRIRSILSREPVVAKIEQNLPMQGMIDHRTGEVITVLTITASILQQSPQYDSGYPYDAGVQYG